MKIYGDMNRVIKINKDAISVQLIIHHLAFFHFLSFPLSVSLHRSSNIPFIILLKHLYHFYLLFSSTLLPF